MAIAAIVVPSLGALSSFIIDELGITRTQLGWLFASVSLASAVLAPTSGNLADRHGGRRMVLTLLTIGVLVLLGLAVAPTFQALFAMGLLAGAMNSIGNPATNWLIASKLPIGERGLIMGIKQSGIPAGIALAGVFFPLAAQAMGWRAALAVASLAPAAILLFVRRVLPPDAPRRSGSLVRVSASEFSLTKTGPSVAALVVYSFLMGLGDVAIIAFGPLYLQEVIHWDVALAGRAIAVAGALGIGARILWSVWAERRQRLPLTLVVMACSSFCAAAAFWIASATTDLLVWLGIALFGSVSFAWNAIVYLIAISSGRIANPGGSSGWVMLGFMTGNTVGPIAFGYTVDLTGSYDAGWIMVLTSFGLAVLHAVRFTRRKAKDGIDRDVLGAS
jgi:sugar phosphate permease